MSGDVQPRKRKDKRRKKDDSPGQEEPTVLPSAPERVIEDFNIHVHNDHGTGGGICAKLIFFVLLSVLAVLVGLIITEHRGATDLDTPASESRFANIFDGWIDESINVHADHSDDAHGELENDHDDHDEHDDHDDEHDEDHDEHDEEDEHDEQDDEEEHDDHEESEEEYQASVEEEQQGSEEQDTDVDQEEADEDEDDQQVSEEQATEEDEQQESEEQQLVSEEEQEDDEATADDDDNDQDDENDNISNDVDNDEQLDEENNDDADSGAVDDDDADDDDANDDDGDAATEEDEEVEEKDNVDENTDASNENEQEDDADHVQANSNEDDAADDEAAADDFSKENEVLEEDSAEAHGDLDGADDQEEEVVDNTAGEDEALKEEAEKQEAAEEESSSMAVKIGVGVALVVVAHIVLVRKWRSGQPSVAKTVQEEEIISDLSRRNTIVAPVPLEQIEHEIENVEDEYSEEEEEEEEESEEEIIIEPVPKKTYQELHSTYSRTLPSENVTKGTLESVIPKIAPRVIYYDEDNQGDDDDEEVEYEEEEEEVEEDNEEEGEDEDAEEVEEGDDGEDVEEVEEVEEVDEDDISDVDDEELLKKLEAKYGKLPSTRDNKAEEDLEDDKFDTWKRVKVMSDNNAEDSEGSEEEDPWAKKPQKVSADLQQKAKVAEATLRDNAELALSLYTNLMEKLPNNIQMMYGRARALDRLAEVKRSNDLLQDAITAYSDLLQNTDISDRLYLQVAERCLDRIRFRGHYARAVQVHKQIIDRFPNDQKHRNQLAVTLLTSNRLADAKRVLHEVLLRWPDDGFAQVHYGFILKTKDNDLNAAVQYLQAGIKSRDPGVIDGRFYFHLGDALARLGRNDEATKVYEDGVSQKVFLSKYQRSLYNVDRLTGRPWWTLTQTPYTKFFQLLEDKWKLIRNEGLALMTKAGYFKDEAENLRDTGEWKQFELFARGQKFTENCKKCPETCKLIDQFPDAKGCRRGQVKFSVMHPGTHVWPHCGPSNCRLRAHLGLKVPSNTYIRVGDEIRTWHEGKVFLFDDSFEHEVWHNGSDIRLVLIVDVWHPELTAHEKRSLPAI